MRKSYLLAAAAVALGATAAAVSPASAATVKGPYSCNYSSSLRFDIAASYDPGTLGVASIRRTGGPKGGSYDYSMGAHAPNGALIALKSGTTSAGEVFLWGPQGPLSYVTYYVGPAHSANQVGCRINNLGITTT